MSEPTNKQSPNKTKTNHRHCVRYRIPSILRPIFASFFFLIPTTRSSLVHHLKYFPCLWSPHLLANAHVVHWSSGSTCQTICPSVRTSHQPGICPSVRTSPQPGICPSVRTSHQSGICPSVRTSPQPGICPSVRTSHQPRGLLAHTSTAHSISPGSALVSAHSISLGALLAHTSTAVLFTHHLLQPYTQLPLHARQRTEHISLSSEMWLLLHMYMLI
jgi:hypothetical protein